MHRQFPLWIDFYESKLTERVLVAFLQSMDRSCDHIIKLGVVGCSWWDQKRIQRLGKKLEIRLPMPVRFFDDSELAKTWLVSEK